MNRPPGLPSRDARTPESIKNSKFLVEGLDGMVDTPTPEQQKALDESIDRKLQALRKEKEMSPFGVSIVSQVLWKELLTLEDKHREYICSLFQETCIDFKELYRCKLTHREMLSNMLYEHTLKSASKYLSGDGYTYFCNFLQTQLKNTKRIHK